MSIKAIFSFVDDTTAIFKYPTVVTGLKRNGRRPISVVIEWDHTHIPDNTKKIYDWIYKRVYYALDGYTRKITIDPDLLERLKHD
jgi:hypothetical protein